MLPISIPAVSLMALPVFASQDHGKIGGQPETGRFEDARKRLEIEREAIKKENERIREDLKRRDEAMREAAKKRAEFERELLLKEDEAQREAMLKEMELEREAIHQERERKAGKEKKKDKIKSDGIRFGHIHFANVCPELSALSFSSGTKL